MKTIIELLNKEKELHQLLNEQYFPDDSIDKEFQILFNHQIYALSRKWLKNNINPDGGVGLLHDSFISNFSQKRNGNEYHISFTVDPVYANNDDIETGYFSKNIINIKSDINGPLREISNRTILKFLIDEENKELGFLYLGKNSIESISIKYNEIEFIKGEFNSFDRKNKAKLK